MRKIEISEELHQELLRRAISFKDTAESVIWREFNKNKEDATPDSVTKAENTVNHSTDNKTARSPKKRIGSREIKEIYTQARLVFEASKNGISQEREELSNALDYLKNNVGMNRGSANIYIKIFLAMKEGSLHKSKMTINDTATEYFLKRIHEEDGEEGLRTALDAVLANIEYYEEVTKYKYKRKGTRKIHAEFSAKLT